MPRFDQEIEIGIVNVLAEGRISEDVVHGVVGNAEQLGRARGRDATRWLPDRRLTECLDQPGQLVSEIVSRRNLGNLRCNVVDAGELTVDLRIVRRTIPIEDRHSPDGLLHEVEQHVADADVGVGAGPTPHRRQGMRGPGQKEVMDVRNAFRRQTRTVIHVSNRQPVRRDYRWKSQLGDASNPLAIIVVGLFFECLAIHRVPDQ